MFLPKTFEKTPNDVINVLKDGEKIIFADYYSYKRKCESEMEKEMEMKTQGLSNDSRAFMLKKIEDKYIVKLNKKFDEVFEKQNGVYVKFINNLFYRYNIDIKVKYVW